MSEEQLIATPGVFGETGNFLLERELGRGGMGGVYMGRDKMLDRPVAVKVMLKEYGSDSAFVEKFKHEAQAAARLIHPNIAQVYSYGIADGMPYIAMELVAGGSLDKLMANAGAATDIPRVMKICEQVAQALRCAADQGLVHGDVKPENVLLDANGNAKLVDFGLAAMQNNTDEVWGTPYYIAPEKVEKKPVDYRADMYSLGGTLYHALTGVAPFEGDDAAAVVRKRFEAMPVPPSQLRPEITPQIDALVMGMLAMNPADRFPTFEALLEEFHRVMSAGLPSTAAGTSMSLPPVSGTVSSAGGRRIVMKTRKRFKVKASVDEGGSGEEHESKRTSQPPEEDEGGVAGKIIAVIGITIAVIALVAGGLVWYIVSDKKAREAEKQAQISSQIDKARTAIAEIREKAVAFADEFDGFAAKAVKECQKPTDDLTRALTGKFDEALVSQIKPGPTAELLEAIALTNVVVKAEGGDTNATATAEAKAPAAAPAPAVKIRTASGKVVQFRDPTDDEADPASPEHEEYLKQKAQWEKDQKEKAEREEAEKKAAAEKGETPVDAIQASAKASPETAKNETMEAVIRDMTDLWERAYGCQAAAIRIRHRITKLIEKIDAFKCDGNDEVTMANAARFSNEVSDEYEQIKASDEVSKVQKGIGYIKAKGPKTVQQTANRLLVAANEAARQDKADRERKAEEERQARLAQQKSKTIEEDNAKIKEKFDALSTAGVFRQLDWKGAIRQLTVMREEFKYADSQIVADGIILKVKMMATVQDVFITNCKGYTFAKSKLANCKIVDISDKEIKLMKADGKTPMKLSWVKFYGSYHGNLNELIIKFIEKGKDSSKTADGKRLSLQPWAEAMMGAALTMQVICSDDVAAATRAEQIAKNAVKAYPDYLKHAQEIFPDFTFDVTAE